MATPPSNDPATPPSNDSANLPVTVITECLLATREVGRCLYRDVHARDGHLTSSANALRRRVRDETEALGREGCGEWGWVCEWMDEWVGAFVFNFVASDQTQKPFVNEIMCVRQFLFAD